MASKNAETSRAIHEAWTNRDFDTILARMTPDAVWTDEARGVTFKGPEDFRENFLQGWVNAFPDGRITNARYYDAGQAVFAQFTGEGRNDGPLGPLPATGKTAAFTVWEIHRYNADGQVTDGETLYDQLGLLIQLGHAQPPAPQ